MVPGVEPSSEEGGSLYGRSLVQGSRGHEFDDQSSHISEPLQGSNFRSAQFRTSDRYGFHLASPSPSPPLNNGHFGAVGSAGKASSPPGFRALRAREAPAVEVRDAGAVQDGTAAEDEPDAEDNDGKADAGGA